MDAIKFVKEYNRMCKTYHYCDGCSLAEKGCLTRTPSNNIHFLIGIVKTVEKWSKKYPDIQIEEK